MSLQLTGVWVSNEVLVFEAEREEEAEAEGPKNDVVV
jgi:hypothetical protein